MMQRYFAINKEQDKIILEPSDIHHITNVMRMNDGDEIEVVFDSKLYLCCIVNVKFDIQISVKKELKFEEKNLEIVLIIPILKEQKMDYILQKSTELGVTKIVPITTERTLVKLDEEKRKMDKNMQRSIRTIQKNNCSNYRKYVWFKRIRKDEWSVNRL